MKGICPACEGGFFNDIIITPYAAAVGELATRVPRKIDAYAGTATKIAEEIVSEEEKK